MRGGKAFLALGLEKGGDSQTRSMRYFQFAFFAFSHEKGESCLESSSLSAGKKDPAIIINVCKKIKSSRPWGVADTCWWCRCWGKRFFLTLFFPRVGFQKSGISVAICNKYVDRSTPWFLSGMVLAVTLGLKKSFVVFFSLSAWLCSTFSLLCHLQKKEKVKKKKLSWWWFAWLE